MSSELETPGPAIDGLAELLDAISSSAADPDDVPPGWFTVHQVSAASGRAFSTESQRLRTHQVAGKLDRRQFTVRGADGRLKRVWHYKAKAK